MRIVLLSTSSPSAGMISPFSLEGPVLGGHSTPSRVVSSRRILHRRGSIGSGVVVREPGGARVRFRWSQPASRSRSSGHCDDRCKMKPSSIGIRFSHQSAVVVEDRDPLLRWEVAGRGLDEVDNRLRRRGVVPGELSQPCAPLAASAIFSSAWSMVKLAAFWRGGNSSNVARNWATIACAAMIM
jgi:hypothetical protein